MQALTRHTPRWWPSAVGAAGVAAAGYVVSVDPARAVVRLPCPFHAVTGWWCPGCGLTRATHHLLRGDVATAFSFHALVPVAVGLAVWAWLSWWWPSVGGRPVPRPSAVPAPVWITLGAALLGFGVLRNLAPFSPLAP